MERSTADPAHPVDEIRPVTSLFADVVGSTSLGERLPTIEVKAIIGECVTRMCETVEEFGGTVTAYMGDGIAAFFGIESALEHQAVRAARAALEIRRVIRQYAEEVRSTWGVQDFNVRMGLNSGRVAVGPVGSGNPQVLALGDAVNVAARLQSAAAPGSIVVGEETAICLRAGFAMASLGGISVKGRAEPVVAYRLDEESHERDEAVDGFFIGRGHELQVMECVLDDLTDGRGQVCFVSGEAGLGKTRLLRETRLRASSDVIWLSGRCDSVDRRTPFEPFVDVFREWLGITRSSTGIEARVRLVARGSELFGDAFDDVLPHLARLLQAALPTKVARRIDGLPPELLVRGLYDAFTSWLSRLTQQAPVVLVIDNFGVASTSVIDMTRAILPLVDSVPIALVLAVRPDQLGVVRDLRNDLVAEFPHRIVELRIPPLAAAEADGLLQALDHSCVLDESTRQVLVARAEGNPLYLEQLASSVFESGAERVDEDRALPDALETLLLARIDALQLGPKTALQSAAVIGRRFTREHVAGMCQNLDIDHALRALLRADMIRESGRDPVSYSFKHGLLRDAAISTLPPRRLSQLCGMAASALRRSPDFNEERDAEALARLYFAAGDHLAAVVCLETHADNLNAVFRFSDAATAYRDCISKLGDGEGSAIGRLTLKLARVLGLQGRDDEALEAIDHGLQRSDGACIDDLLLEKADRLADQGSLDDADRVIASVVSEAGSADSRARAIARRGRLALARQDLRLAEMCTSEIGDLAALPIDVRFEVTSVMAGVLALEGDFSASEGWAREAEALADTIGRTTDQLIARRHVALLCVLQGNMREGYERMRSVYEEYAKLGLTSGQLEAAVNLSHAAVLVGELREGERVASEALTLANSEMWRALILTNLSGILIGLNELERASEIAREVLMKDMEGPSWPRSSALLVLATVHIIEGRWSEAMECAVDARAAASQPGREGERLFADLALAEITYGMGDPGSALAMVERVLAELGQSERMVAIYAGRLHGSILADLGDSRALDTLQSALAECRRTGMVIEEGRTLIAIARADPDAADDHLRLACEIFAETSCARGLAEADEARARLVSSASN